MTSETNIEIRRLDNKDSLEKLTSLIHRAYRQLADLGFRYWGTHQTTEDTKKRVSNGECYVGVNKSKIIGTILLTPPCKIIGNPYYNRPDVSTFHQFAIEPDFQNKGYGSQLLNFIENRAIELGARELACDTADKAVHLIDFYLRRGYRKVDEADWDITNYKSVILSKSLSIKYQCGEW